METTEEDIKMLNRIRNTVDTYEKELAEREKRKKEQEAPKEEKKEMATKDDLALLLKKINMNKKIDSQQITTTTDQQVIQPVKQNVTKDQQIAFQLWKDAKATSIVCMIAIVLPFIGILVSMFPGGAMYAMVIVMVGVIYPCIVFVKAVAIQRRAHMKYGLKPLFQLPQQQFPPQGNVKHNQVHRGEMF